MPALPLTYAEAVRAQKLLGAAVVSPVPLPEVMELYSRFRASYERARQAAQLGKGRGLERMEWGRVRALSALYTGPGHATVFRHA